MSRFLENSWSLGVEGSLDNSENRITIFTNLIAYWTMFSVFPVGFFLSDQGVDPVLFIPVHLAFLVLGCFALYFNYNKNYTSARFLALLGSNICGWQAAFLYGKTFNGYLFLYAALFYSLLAFTRSKPLFRFLCFFFTFLGLPIIDFLSHRGFLPVTDLDASMFNTSVLITDTIIISVAISIIVFVEKQYSLGYENQLENLNTNLERIVAQRTRELVKSKDELLESATIKAQFFANISHELRIPMQAILGYSEMGRRRVSKSIEDPAKFDQKLLGKIQSDYTGIKEGTDRMISLVDRLLMITRKGDKGLLPFAHDFSIADALEKVMDKMPKDMQSVELDIKKCVVYSDETLFQQTIQNVLENAAQYSRAQSSIKVKGINAGANYQLEITNKGLGIHEDEVELIFEPFFQGSRTDNKTGGTGLGLYVSRKFIRTLGGQILVSDASPDSTTFQIILPLGRPLKDEVDSLGG